MQFWLKGLSLSLNLCGGVQCWPRHLWTGPTLQGHLSGNKKQQPPTKTTHKLIQASENNCVQKQNYLFSLFHQEIDFVLTSVTLRLQRSLQLFRAAVTRYAKGSCGTFKYLWLCLENVVVVKRGEVCICSIKTRETPGTVTITCKQSYCCGFIVQQMCRPSLLQQWMKRSWTNQLETHEKIKRTLIFFFPNVQSLSAPCGCRWGDTCTAFQDGYIKDNWTALVSWRRFTSRPRSFFSTQLSFKNLIGCYLKHCHF